MNEQQRLPTDRSTAADEATYLVRLQAGEAQAWEEFMDRYSPELFNYLKQQLPDEEAAQDLLSETFLAVVQGIRKIEQAVDLHPFIYAAAERKINEFVPRKISMTVPQWLFETASPFTEELAQLTAQDQELFRFRYLEGLSIQEIAQRLGKPTGVIQLLLRSVRHQISQVEHGVLQSVLPKDYELADSLSRRPLLAAVYPMLLLQQQLCQHNEMSAEAMIFGRARAAIEQMAATPAASFPDVLLRVEMLLRVVQESVAQDPAPLLRQWLERHPKYDNSGQL